MWRPVLNPWQQWHCESGQEHTTVETRYTVQARSKRAEQAVVPAGIGGVAWLMTWASLC